MTLFQTSTTARGIFAGASIALLGGGLTTILGLDPSSSVPLVLTATGVTGFVSLILGANVHSQQIATYALLLPIAFWCYSFVLMFASTMPVIGWALLAMGLVTVGFFFAASNGRASQPPVDASNVSLAEAEAE